MSQILASSTLIYSIDKFLGKAIHSFDTSVGFRILIFVFLFLFSIIVLELLFLFFYHQYKTLRTRYARGRTRYFRDRLLAFLADQTPEASLELYIPRYDRKIFRDLLLKYIYHVKDSYRDKLLKLYIEYGFLDNEIKDTRARFYGTRVKAAYNLGKFREPEVAGRLIELLKDPIEAVRIAAASSLGEIEHLKGIRYLFGELSSRYRLLVATIISGLGTKVFDSLKETIETSDDKHTKVLCIKILIATREPRGKELIYKFLKSDDLDLRLNALRYLGKLKDPEGLRYLFECLKDPSWEARATAVKALSNYDLGTRATDIAFLLSDRQWYVRYNTAWTLAKMGKPGRAQLLEAVRSNPDRYARDISKKVLIESKMGLLPFQLKASEFEDAFEMEEQMAIHELEKEVYELKMPGEK